MDLIVMGTHGRSGLAHLLIGSVAGESCAHGTVPGDDGPARAGSADTGPGAAAHSVAAERQLGPIRQAELLDPVSHLVAVDPE